MRWLRVLGTRSHGSVRAWIAVVGLVVLLFAGPIAPVAAQAPIAAPVPGAATTHTTVLLVTQTPLVVREQSSMTISMEVSNASQISQVYFTFCELSNPVCFLPVAMTLQGSNLFVGSTHPMSSYNGMVAGARGGYNITIVYADNSTQTEPALPNTFPNLTVSQSVTAENMFAMVVTAMTYDLSGRVVDSQTGAAIGNATVTASPGGYTTVSANGTGNYSFAALPNGTYNISASKGGFHTANVTVSITGQSSVKDLSLTDVVSHPPPSNGTNATTSVNPLGMLLPVIAVGFVMGFVAFTVSFLVRRRRGPRMPGGSAGPPMA